MGKRVFGFVEVTGVGGAPVAIRSHSNPASNALPGTSLRPVSSGTPHLRYFTTSAVTARVGLFGTRTREPFRRAGENEKAGAAPHCRANPALLPRGPTYCHRSSDRERRSIHPYSTRRLSLPSRFQ